jgi:hypothetical protein
MVIGIPFYKNKSSYGRFGKLCNKKYHSSPFLTSDLKYHQFYEAENKLLLADIGFESGV